MQAPDRVRSGLLLLLGVLLALPAIAAGSGAAGPDRVDETAVEVAGGAVPTGVRRLADLHYGPAPAHTMDVYLPPPAAPAGPFPVLFMVHGGAWAFGDKGNAAVVDNKLARWLPRGFVLVSINYRLLPQAAPLQQAADVARALAFAQKQAPQWGADAKRFILMGHSAGAHLVSLLTASAPLAAEVAPWLGSISLDTAGFDMVALMQSRHARLYDRAFGDDVAYWRAASPLHQLRAGMPPLLAVCSQRRRQSCLHSHAFAAQAAAKKVRVEVLEQDLSHGRINSALGQEPVYTAAVEAFMAALDHDVAARLARP